MKFTQLTDMDKPMRLNGTSRSTIALGAALACAAISLQAHAEQVTKPAAGATKVVISTVGELSVRQGNEEKVVIEAEPKVLAKLDVSTKGDTLTITSKGDFSTQKPLTFTVTLKSLRSLTTSGSGNSVVEGFSGPNFDLDLNGSGDVSLKNLKAAKLSVLVQSSGSVDVTGSGNAVVARIDGSGNIDARNYRARIVDASIEGAGSISVHAEESLKAAIGGAGSIEYKGKPKVTQNITGAGTVGPL